jgi:20S proteasome alpha/beta subunit
MRFLTIAICVWVPEGVVIASESRQVYKNPKNSYKVVSDKAQKVFQLSPRAGGITCGLAYIGDKSILSLVEEFKASRRADLDKLSTKELATELGRYLDKKYKNEEPISGPDTEWNLITLILAGYDEAGNRQILECSVPGASVIEIGNRKDCGMTWRGQSDVVTRLINGFDPRINKLSWFRPEYLADLEALNYNILLQALTMQDAIDFAVFLIRTTIDTQRFTDGIKMDLGEVAGTGGPIDIAVLRPNEGFSWVKRKQLMAEGNPARTNAAKNAGKSRLKSGQVANG